MRAPRPFVRIIGGKWRGRRLPVPLSASFRPSGDRIREALFSCLGGRLDGRICLDLFAGTGALGLEAASRGAAKVVFVERDAKSLARTAEVAKILNADNGAEFSAVRADIFAWLASEDGGKGGERFPRAGAPAPACVSGRSSARMRGGGEDGGVERFDLIFADPPFADYRKDSSWEKLLSAVGPRLAPGGRVYCESDRFFPLPSGWLEEKARKAGRAHWRILRRMERVGEEGGE